MKKIIAVTPWAIAAAIIGLGLFVPVLGPKYFGLSATDNAVLSGALGGGLIGAGGALFASLVGNLLQRNADQRERELKIANARTLITAELVNVATGLISAERLMTSAIQTLEVGGPVSSIPNFSREMPRGTPITDTLGGELLLLDADSVDALITLKSNLAITSQGLLEVTNQQRLFGLLSASQLREGIRHDMEILAQCFERFAPERKFQLPNQQAELASIVLRRIARDNSGSQPFR